MTDAHRGSPVSLGRAAVVAFALTLSGHYAWELAQAQWFADHAGARLSSYAWHCFVAAWADVLIAAASYGLTALLFRRTRWALEAKTLGPAILWITFGLVITVLIELSATASGRWTYAPSMPTVLGIGLLPLAQWILVPVLTLVVFRAIHHHRDVARRG